MQLKHKLDQVNKRFQEVQDKYSQLYFDCQSHQCFDIIKDSQNEVKGLTEKMDHFKRQVDEITIIAEQYQCTIIDQNNNIELKNDTISQLKLKINELKNTVDEMVFIIAFEFIYIKNNLRVFFFDNFIKEYKLSIKEIELKNNDINLKEKERQDNQIVDRMQIKIDQLETKIMLANADYSVKVKGLKSRFNKLEEEKNTALENLKSEAWNMTQLKSHVEKQKNEMGFLLEKVKTLEEENKKLEKKNINFERSINQKMSSNIQQSGLSFEAEVIYLKKEEELKAFLKHLEQEKNAEIIKLKIEVSTKVGFNDVL
jgi:hypothetical protein